jgi:hypothetical protein
MPGLAVCGQQQAQIACLVSIRRSHTDNPKANVILSAAESKACPPWRI